MTKEESIINDIRNGKAMVVDTEWLQTHDKNMIDKACEWLRNNINSYLYNRGGYDEYIPTCGDTMFEDFRKAMLNNN